MNDRGQLGDSRTNGRAERQQACPFVGFQEDPLFRHALPEHGVLGLEEFDVPTKLILGATSQQKEQGREQIRHGGCSLLVPTKFGGDNLFARLPSAA
jgi:hypothetical protein